MPWSDAPGRTAIVLWAELLVLRALFVLRRPELVREPLDALLGSAWGALGDAGLALLAAALVTLAGRRAHRVLAPAFAFLFAAAASLETEYFAWSHNRFDATFLAYAREWRTLGGSIRGQASPAFLALHLVVALAGVWFLRHRPQARQPTRAAVALAAGALALAPVLLVPRAATSWFGSVAAGSPELGLARAALRDEQAAAPPGPEVDAALATARAVSDPFHAKDFFTDAPLAHAADRLPEGSAFTRVVERPNVLFVLLEGMPANVVAHSGAPPGLTPELDRLADRGLYFPNFFANGAHTPRALDATLCGLWPRLVGAPLSRAQPRMPVRCLPALLRDEGWQTSFVHGGFETFENRFEFLGRIGFRDLRFFEEFGEGVLPRTNGGWGTTDEETYAEALRRLDGMDPNHPFFLTVLSISNHHPFRVPDPSLETAHDEALRPNDTIRYADRELGRFVDALDRRGLLATTLVFILGDHGLTRANANAEGDGALHEQILARLNVPLVVLAPPGTFAPGIVDRTASQVDLLPTVLHLAGLRAASHAVGSTLAWTLPPTSRDLPVVVHDLYSELVARIEPGRLSVAAVEPGRAAFGSPSVDWRRESGTARVTPVAPDPARAAELRAIVTAVNHLYAAERWWPAGRAR